MQFKSLWIVSAYLLATIPFAFGSAGTLIGKKGNVLVLRHTYYPVNEILNTGESVEIGDVIYTGHRAMALLRFNGNIPIFLNSDTSLSIERTGAGSEKGTFRIFLRLNHGELSLYSEKIFLATPLVLVETIQGTTIVRHDQTENYSAVSTMHGQSYVSGTKEVSKKLHLKAFHRVEIFDPLMLKTGSPHGNPPIKSLSQKATRDLKKSFHPGTLLGLNYRPSFLDSIFRKILLSY